MRIRDIQPEEIAPIVNLVNELEEESGGVKSEYGQLGDITWSTNKYSRDDYMTVHIKIDNWTFWNGDQLQAFKDRINQFAENHENRNGRVLYLEQDREITCGLKLPEDKTQDGDE